MISPRVFFCHVAQQADGGALCDSPLKELLGAERDDRGNTVRCAHSNECGFDTY